MPVAPGFPPETIRWYRPSARLRTLADRWPAGQPRSISSPQWSRISTSESSSTAIIPRPSRSTFTMPKSAQSSLSHCTTTRPGMVAGSSGTTVSKLPWHTTMPPECCPRCRGRSCSPTTSSRNLRILGFCKSSPASWNCFCAVLSWSFQPHTGTRLDSRSSVSTSNPNTLPASRAADRPR